MGRDARAGAFYLETAAGASIFQNGDAFFSGATGARSNIGIGFDVGVFKTFTNGDAAVEIQLGLLNRVANDSQGNSYYSAMVPYPVIRLQVSRVFFAGGVSPFVWQRVSGSPGLDSFSMASGTLAFFAQAGVLYPATPKFSLGLAAGAQVFTTGGTISPQPLADISAQMRFYFGFSEGGSGGGRGSNEFHGWRYPFGMEIRN